MQTRIGSWLAVAALMLASFGAAHADVPALIEAAKSGDKATVQSLIRSGVDVNATEPDGTTALHWAAHYGHAEIAQALIRAGAKVNVVNDYGSSPMSEAATIASVPVLKVLLKAGADVNSPNPEGQTALMAVARTGNIEAAKLLLKHGAIVDAREQWGGQTALMWAAAQSQPEMVKLLIKAGADVNARSVVRNWQRRVTAEGRPKDMNRGGLTPLLFAAREGCVECAKALVEGGADINMTDPDRTTPLVLAIMNLRWDTAKYLIEAGADVNKWDFYGQTPLYMAVDLNTLPKGGRVDLPSSDDTSGLEIIEMLLKAGANPNAQLKLRPPYRNAIFDRGGDQILSTGATPLLRAAKASDNEAIKLLLKYGAKVDLPNAEGVTPMMAACGMGHGANPTRGRFKTEKDAIESYRILKAAGADILLTNQGKMTALHAAASHGWNEVVKQLIADGAPVDAKDARGLLALDFALGQYPRGFLEPEHKVHTSTAEILKAHMTPELIAQSEARGNQFKQQTVGTGGAPATARPAAAAQ